ncbi:Uncharacterized protein Adt_02866 [Abeliophyllum distichum]|uniref:Reverse transcriptase domain-containing protein n=1 Tax=Abeliophyllum distichum TaxID=126358 RepID=A0ABD1VWX6_9LAMI
MTILDVEMIEDSEEANMMGDITMEEAMLSEDLDPRVTGTDSQTFSVEELEIFILDPKDPTRRLQVGKDLRSKSKEALKMFLSHNLDVFAWKHKDIIEIDPKESYHQLKVDPKFPSHR